MHSDGGGGRAPGRGTSAVQRRRLAPEQEMKLVSSLVATFLRPERMAASPRRAGASPQADTETITQSIAAKQPEGVSAQLRFCLTLSLYAFDHPCILSASRQLTVHTTSVPPPCQSHLWLSPLYTQMGVSSALDFPQIGSL
jgi:hypothetical protein